MTGPFPSSVYLANAAATLDLQQYYYHSGERESHLGANEGKFVLFKSGGCRHCIVYCIDLLFYTDVQEKAE